jgi:hypothetical protein
MSKREQLMLGAGDDEDAPFGFSDEMAVAWDLGPSPGYLADFVGRVRLHTTAGYVFVLGGGLGAASAVAPPALHLRQHGTRIEGNVWPILVGGSGTYKTTAALWGIDALESFPHLRIPHPDSVQGLKEFYVRKFRGEKDPSSGEHFGGDPFPCGVLAYDEMMGFWEETAPRQRLAGLRPLLTALYDNKGIEKLTRDADNTFRVPRARLTMMGAVTPSTLEDYMTPNAWGNGFGARFLWLGALPRIATLRYDRPDEIDKEAISRMTMELAMREVTPCAGLYPDARKLLAKYYAGVRAYMPYVSRKLHGLFGRYDVNTIRVALLHAYTTRRVDQPGWCLSAMDIEWARRVVFASLVCARVLYRRLALTPYQKLRSELVHTLRGGPRTKDELARLLLVKPRVLEEMIHGLAEEKRVYQDASGGSIIYHWVPLDQLHLTQGTTGAEVCAALEAQRSTPYNVVSLAEHRAANTPAIPPRPAEPAAFVVQAPVAPIAAEPAVKATLVRPAAGMFPSVFAEDE